jgi:DHA3 family macrolide efflux protein-like MFS transporter
MLIGGIALGLVLGLLLGGHLEHLADIRLRFLPLLFLAVILRFATEAMLGFGVEIVDALRVPLLALAYGLLLVTLWKNRAYPGLALAFIGIASNALVILVNGGHMPVWTPALKASGLPPELTSVLHIGVDGTGAEFLVRLVPFADIIPIPIPPFQNVASIGDLFLTAGLGFFLFATLMRTPAETRAAIEEAKTGRYLGLSGTTRLPRPSGGADREPDAGALGVRAGTGLTPSLGEAAALERPLMMGAGSLGMSSPSQSSIAIDGGAAGVLVPGGIAVPPARPRRRPLLPRIRRHPYVRLALNGSFSALWVGQIISLFGDRVNQIALGALVYQITGSALLLALTFFVGTIPNLIISPVAGAFVDRWDQKQVLVVSDILRAALVLLIPVAVLINVWLVYPLVFLITTVSIFFRPARVTVLPRLVSDQDLLSANSAMWVGETLADVVFYPIAGLFVVFLAGSLAIAFWFDAATYLASAALLSSIFVPPLVRRARGEASDATGGATGDGSAARIDTPTSIRADLRAGWVFLRHETVLLANTLQGTAGQFAAGIVTVSTLVLAKELTRSAGSEYAATYAFMETAIGLGSLLGGFALGLVASRVRKGPLVIAAYIVFGLLVFLVGLADSIPLILGLLFGCGVANMAFVIPSQTLFQERTPPELMGRVVSLRFALVFGGMSLAMVVGGVLVGVFGPGPVIAAAGLLSAGAGLAGLGVKALREA